MELLSPWWSSSRLKRQYNAVILSDCFIIFSSMFGGQSANTRLLPEIISSTRLFVYQLCHLFWKCAFPVKAAAKLIGGMPVFQAYLDLRKLLPHRNRSVTSTVLVDADIAFFFLHIHLPFFKKVQGVWDAPNDKNLRVWQHRMCLLFCKHEGFSFADFCKCTYTCCACYSANFPNPIDK